MAGQRPGRRRRMAATSLEAFWTNQALRNLEEIDAYISRDNPNTARRWVQKLIAAAEQAAMTPLLGRIVPEKNRRDIREWLVRNYRVGYRVREKRIDILTIFEGHYQFPKGVSFDHK
jgi:toxin ParE1/3/4